MKLFNNWTKFEKTFLCISVFSTIVVSIIFKSDILPTICSITGIITLILIAKGKNSGQIWGILYTILYSIISFTNKYYGEVIMYMFLMFPMFVIGSIAWYKHTNIETDSLEINSIGKKEWLVISFAIPCLFVGIYYLLKVFNTEELIFSTLSALSCLLGTYLQIRRSISSYTFHLINDIFLIILWGVPLTHGDYAIFPMLLNASCCFTNDVYGLYNWKKLIKLQRL